VPATGLRACNGYRPFGRLKGDGQRRPPPTTDQARWAGIFSYNPADTCYTGAPHHIFSADLGLELGQPIKADIFRVVYP
jgi:hypothetical protein